MLLALLLAQAIPFGNPEGPIYNQPNLMGGLAFFEAFNGKGTSGPCSTTAPTGAKGEALTFTRASNGTCTKTASGGLATTGIADSDLVFLTANQPRVEFDGAGALGLLVESASSPGNIAVQSELPCNAAYSDVGTPSCSAGAASGPAGAATMAQFTDASAVAFAGRSQVIADTSQTAHTVYAYVKAGTATSATITLVGTGNSAGDCSATVTGLSTTTSSILGCTGAAYGVGITAVTVSVNVGTVVADTGTLFVYGYDVKPAGAYRTSHIPTTAAAATRAAEGPVYFTIPATEVQSFASTVRTAGGFNGNARVLGEAWKDSNNELIGYTAGPGASALTEFQIVGGASKANISAASINLNASNRLAAWFVPSTNMGVIVNGTETTTAVGVLGAVTGVTRVYVGNYSGSAGYESDSIHSRICVDPSALRCR